MLLNLIMYVAIGILLIAIGFLFIYREYKFQKLSKEQLIELKRKYKRIRNATGTNKFDKVIAKIERKLNNA